MFHLFQTINRIVYGNGSISQLGNEVKRFGCDRVVVITDPGLAKNNIHQPAVDSLKKAGVACHVFSEVELDPSPTGIEKCAQVIKEFKGELLVGIGGGSVLDCTKGASLLASQSGSINEYYGMHLVPSPCLPTILIPTSAGTGSEMTSICVVDDPITNSKRGIASDHLYAKLIVLDTELTMTLPQRQTAYTGLDAIVHCIESYVNKNATPFTEGPALLGMKMLVDNLLEAYFHGDNKVARANMLYGSSICGMSFSNTQNGVIHSIGMAVPATYHIPHGLMMSAVAPMGMKFNSIAAPHKFAKIAEILGCPRGNKDLYEYAASAADGFAKLMEKVGIEQGLAPYGVKREEIRSIAELAASTKRLMDGNPRKATADELEALIIENF